eukprot:GHRR01024222.1.p2 GENE.GHRR01024222.1~~GHRR01024222.1.p2  ORF type:complete len:166 (-),score=46.01 GHRR01024222.1:1103-1600(-)
MAEHLLPPHDLTAAAPRTAGGGAYADEDSPRGNSKAASTYELLFKQEVTLIDEQGSIFRVQYEGVSCNQQKHLRLTSGWRDYIRCHGVEVGEACGVGCLDTASSLHTTQAPLLLLALPGSHEGAARSQAIAAALGLCVHMRPALMLAPAMTQPWLTCSHCCSCCW